MKSCDPVIYLASQSPRRRDILRQIGVPHAVVSVNVEEKPHLHEAPSDYVQRLAREKALAGLAVIQANSGLIKPVLGADTIGVCDGRILEKPRDATHAAEMLRQLAGNTHQVLTAVALAVKSKVAVQMSITDVVFRPLSAVEIERYWQTGEPQDKAGGYAIQGFGAVFVEQIRGSYSGVVGLPIEQTIKLFDEFSVPWWQAVE